jgi:hypothetical protein
LQRLIGILINEFRVLSCKGKIQSRPLRIRSSKRPFEVPIIKPCVEFRYLSCRQGSIIYLREILLRKGAWMALRVGGVAKVKAVSEYGKLGLGFQKGLVPTGTNFRIKPGNASRFTVAGTRLITQNKF